MKINTYPEIPASYHKLWYYLNENCLKYSVNPVDCSLGFHVDTNPFCRYKHFDFPFPVINGQLTNCSKKEIERLHKKIFGYGSWIDSPKGWHVLKDDLQCSKSAKLVCFNEKIELKPNQFAQKLLSFGYTKEYRCVIMDGIVAWIVKEKEITPKNLCGKVLCATWSDRPDAYFNNSQRDKILQFCSEMKLEFGEIDILVDSEKLYIIDVNNQPGDRAFHMENFDSKGFKRYLCGKFMDFITPKL